MAEQAGGAVRARYLGWGLRLAGTVAALAVVFSIVPVGEVIAAARRLPPALWLAALGLFLVAHAITAAKWWLLIGGHGTFGQVYKAHLAGLGANLALPGVAGGDVVRAALVIRAQGRADAVAAGSIADRLIDTGALALLALLGFWAVLAHDLSLAGLAWRLAVLALLATGGLLAFALVRLPELAPGEQAGKVKRLALSTAAALARLARTPRLLVAGLLASLAAQLLLIAINVALAQALALHLPFAVWAYGWSLAKIIAILPISLGGLGVREASLAALFQPFGAAPGLVVAVGLIWQTILYASGVLGILVGALAGRMREPRVPTPAASKR
jgi:uncharacterized membrane protein YbhN (UPF0104 family)